MFYVVIKEICSILDKVETIEQGKALIEEYEKDDVKCGIYSAGFYDILDDVQLNFRRQVMKERYELIKKAVENGSLKIVELYSPSKDFEGRIIPIRCMIYADGKKVCESNSVSDALVDASLDIPELYDYILDWIKWEKTTIE